MKTKVIIAIGIIVIIIVCGLANIGRKTDVRTDKSLDGLPEELQEVLYLGSLAPNSHNIQSWKISLFTKEQKLRICTDSDRKLPVVDPNNRECYISLGCYTQTLMYAFRAHGYSCDYSFDREKKEVTLSYQKTGRSIDYALIENIKKRHTDKAPFEKSNDILGEEIKKYMDEAGNIYYYENDGPKRDMIKDATLSAYIKQAGDEDAAAELSKWLRLSNKETMEMKDGLPAEQLGIHGFKKALYYLFTNHESAKGETFAEQGIATTKSQLSDNIAFVLITSEGSTEQLVECGMKTVRLWIEMVKAGISVHPMSYAIEDPSAKKDLEENLGVTGIQMILRVGRVSDYGKNMAVRRDLADYISVY